MTTHTKRGKGTGKEKKNSREKGANGSCSGDELVWWAVALVESSPAGLLVAYSLLDCKARLLRPDDRQAPEPG